MGHPFPPARLFSFVAGRTGGWRVRSTTAVVGAPLPSAERLAVVHDVPPGTAADGAWTLSGST